MVKQAAEDASGQWDEVLCPPWLGGGARGEGGPGGLQFELDELVLHVLEVMKEFVQRTAQSWGAAAETGPDESADWFQRWREEMSNGSQEQEGLKQVQKCLLHLYVG